MTSIENTGLTPAASVLTSVMLGRKLPGAHVAKVCPGNVSAAATAVLDHVTG
jgi:hypothetical protein